MVRKRGKKHNPNNDFVSWGGSKLPTSPRYKYENLTESEYRLIIQAKTQFDEIVYNTVFAYLNDKNLCNYEDGMFPRCDRMTGNYYISDENYQLRDGGVYGSIFTRFTELEPKEQDYLGLEVWFTISHCGKIEIHGIDSSSI